MHSRLFQGQPCSQYPAATTDEPQAVPGPVSPISILQTGQAFPGEQTCPLRASQQQIAALPQHRHTKPCRGSWLWQSCRICAFEPPHKISPTLDHSFKTGRSKLIYLIHSNIQRLKCQETGSTLQSLRAKQISEKELSEMDISLTCLIMS